MKTIRKYRINPLDPPPPAPRRVVRLALPGCGQMAVGLDIAPGADPNDRAGPVLDSVRRE